MPVLEFSFLFLSIIYIFPPSHKTTQDCNKGLLDFILSRPKYAIFLHLAIAFSRSCYFESDLIGELFSCFQWSLSNIGLSCFHLRPLKGVQKAGIILKCLIIPCTLFFLTLLRSDITQAYATYSVNFLFLGLLIQRSFACCRFRIH